ncbi:cation-dependent mannose-6-phosphate receptor, partial [Tremellales sp. Uapishka_1]
MSDNACTLTLADGTHYDLTSLSSSSADYAAEASGTTYKLNVCRSIVSETWKLDQPEDVGGFISRPDGDFSLGKMNATLHVSPSTSEPVLIYSGGSQCPVNREISATTAIHFICSPSDFGAGTPTLVATLPAGDQANGCQFFFEWKTHVACPTNPKAQLETSHYVAFGVILAIAILTWFGGHTLYNRYYLRLRGREQFPFPSLSAPSLSLPSLPFRRKDASAARPAWGFRRSQRSGYNHVRAEENDEETGFAGRFSLDDGEDEDEEDLTGMEDARALGGNVWSERTGGQGTGGAKVGVHQGLVDI